MLPQFECRLHRRSHSLSNPVNARSGQKCLNSLRIVLPTTIGPLPAWLDLIDAILFHDSPV